MTRIFGTLIAVLFLSVGQIASAQDDALLKLARNGDAYAQYSVGWGYYDGYDFEQDYAEAAKWWRLSAEQGYVYSQESLGDAYYKGRGVTQDYVEAAKWWRLAAEQGDASAQHSLAAAYFLGQGVIKDSVYSHMWFNISSSLGGKFSVQGRELTAEYMTPEQIAEAQKLARECVRKEYKDC